MSAMVAAGLARRHATGACAYGETREIMSELFQAASGRRKEWEPAEGEVVVDCRSGAQAGRRGRIVGVDQYGHFAAPYWLVTVLWAAGGDEMNINTCWLTRTDGSQGQLPRQRCVSCGRWRVPAHEIDGNMIMIDPVPVADGPLAGHFNGEDVRVLHNFDADDAAFWDLPADLPRYQRHECSR